MTCYYKYRMALSDFFKVKISFEMEMKRNSLDAEERWEYDKMFKDSKLHKFKKEQIDLDHAVI